MENNYEKQVYIARKYFLNYDRNKLVRKYAMDFDETYLYLKYLGKQYRINTSDGAVEYLEKEQYQPCLEYTIVMTIYDLLCYSDGMMPPLLTGIWQPVSSFPAAGCSPSAELGTEKYIHMFKGKAAEIKKACEHLGGTQLPGIAGADLTFEIPVTSFFSVRFQYWEEDEEFPAKILLLWDKASLSYLHFETTYYLQGDLLEAICQQLYLKEEYGIMLSNEI